MAEKKRPAKIAWSAGRAVVSAIWAFARMYLIMVSRALSNAILNIASLRDITPTVSYGSPLKDFVGTFRRAWRGHKKGRHLVASKNDKIPS